MFKIVETRTAWWPVTWDMADEDGGTVSEARFQAQFRIPDVDGVEALVKKAVALDEDASELPLSERMAELLSGFVADWREIGDADGVALPYSQKALAMLCRTPGVFFAIITALRNCVAGVADIRAKN